MTQTLTQWFIRNFEGVAGARDLRTAIPDVVYDGTQPHPFFATFRNIMYLSTYTANLDQALILCGSPAIALPFAEWPLRILSK